MANKDTLEIINVNDVTSYVVCPEAWRLKRLAPRNTPRTRSDHEAEVHLKKKEWISNQELSTQFRSYATILYCLLVLVVTVLFLFDSNRGLFGVTFLDLQENTVVNSDVDVHKYLSTPRAHLSKMLTVPNEIFLVLVLIGALIFLWDLFDRRSNSLRKNAGFTDRIETVALRGSEDLPSQRLFSEKLQLESEPSAIIKQGRLLIPVVVKPGGRKVQDRHVVELMVHLRLLEETYGDRAPFGIMILGSEKRQVKIQNTDDKQRWLDTLLDEMNSVKNGVPAVPAPSFYKCKRCEVRQKCEHSAFKDKC
jgi:CRISPR/Cas system-associated exonuclease Cas4 (RecB family)